MVRSFVLISLVLGLMLAQVAMATSTMRLSVDDLPKLVREKNQNVLGSEKGIDSARAKTGHLVRSFLPTLRAEVGGETFQTGPYSFLAEPYGGAEIRMNLFRGGKDHLEESARKTEVTASSATAKQTQASELSQARKLYWEIVFSQEMIETLKTAVHQNEKLLEMANRRIARGLSTETDRLEFQIHRSQLKEEIESLQHGLKLLQIHLSAILGMSPDTQLTTETKISHVHDEALLNAEFDSTTYPQVTLLKANQEVTTFQKNQASRFWLPSLDAYAGYSLYTLRDRDYFSQALRDDQVVGIRLTFELWDGFQSKATAKALSLQADSYELQGAQRARMANAQVEIAKENLKHDHELIQNGEERIEQGKKYLNRTLEEYARGVKNSIDALSAAQRHLTFQRQYAERRRNYQLTKTDLLEQLGQ